MSTTPVEWDLPAGNGFTLTTIQNGVEVFYSGLISVAPGTGSYVYGASVADVLGTYPAVVTLRLDTFVDGAPVYHSTLTVSCSVDGPATSTIVNEEISSGGPGPGTGQEIAVGPVAGPDMVLIPDTAVVGSFVTTTPAYFAPQSDAVTSIVLAAGKTLWVFGVDEGGEFYKVMISGRFFWVPVETMGPNFDAVWQGHPLPTNTMD